MKRILLASVAFGAAALCGPGAHAFMATGTMSVTASVSPVCSVSATPLAFGAYSPAVGNSSTSTATVVCTGLAGSQVNGLTFTADAGLGVATNTVRALTNGGNHLDYVLSNTLSVSDLPATGGTLNTVSVSGASDATPTATATL